MLIDYFDRQKCWAADAGDVLDEALDLVSQSVVEIEASFDASRMSRIAKTYADFVVKRDVTMGQAVLLTTLCDVARHNVKKQEITDFAAILGHLDHIVYLSADLKTKITQLECDELKTLELEIDGEGAQ